MNPTPPPPDALPAIRTPIPGPESRALLRRLRAVESPDVTSVGPDFPVVWAAAAGACVIDADGNRFIDATGAFGVALVGHAHPRVIEAARAQCGTLIHGMGDVHPPAIRISLLESLQALAPGDLGHSVLCTGGAEAVEVAIKTALLATGRPGVIAFEGGYHGLSGSALAATWRPRFRAPFAAHHAPFVRFCPFPATEAALDPALAALDELLRATPRPGAVLVEPIQGRAGTVIPPPTFLAEVRARCDRAGALLICDEIFTGLGRTGAWFASEADGALPDLLCVGKALGGGFPISACLGRPDVMAAWGDGEGEALHTSTFLGHPVASAAALAALEVIETEGLVARARRSGRRLLDSLRARLGAHRAIASVRGRGLMTGVELQDCDDVPAGILAWKTVVASLRAGVITLPAGADGRVIQLTPPATATDAQLDHIAAVLAAAVEDATRASHDRMEA